MEVVLVKMTTWAKSREVLPVQLVDATPPVSQKFFLNRVLGFSGFLQF
jgi:hypothetical protein